MLIFVKEFYAKMTVVHLKKKDVIKSSVKGIGIEFDHEQWPPYLVCLEEMEYVNTSKKCGRNQNTQSHLRLQGDLQMMKHSQLPGRVKYDLGRETLEASWIDIYGSSNGKEDSRYARVMMRHMSYVISMKDHELPLWRLAHLGGRSEERRKKEIRMTLVGKAVIDEATVEGESGSDDRFYDARVEVEEPSDETQRHSDSSSILTRCKIKNLRSRPLESSQRRKLNLRNSSEFERKRANRFHDDAEKAKARMPDFSLTSPSSIKPNP
ncbi:hypothetical protein Dimus_021195 [Dionaea muscipula]